MAKDKALKHWRFQQEKKKKEKEREQQAWDKFFKHMDECCLPEWLRFKKE